MTQLELDIRVAMNNCSKALHTGTGKYSPSKVKMWLDKVEKLQKLQAYCTVELDEQVVQNTLYDRGSNQ